jgi:hypothetical protein
MWDAIVIGSGIGGLAAQPRPQGQFGRLLAASLLVGVLAFAPSAQAQSRGELLYSTHCIACHTTQMHWRDKKQATDWNSLKAQVRAWQATARLEWSEDDVAEVARYLNERFYRFVQPSAALGSPNPARADQRAVPLPNLTPAAPSPPAPATPGFARSCAYPPAAHAWPDPSAPSSTA